MMDGNFVYRFRLYSGGFKTSEGKDGSVGGCYMLPLGIDKKHRRWISALRKIAFNPRGLSTMVVVDKIANPKCG